MFLLDMLRAFDTRVPWSPARSMHQGAAENNLSRQRFVCVVQPGVFFTCCGLSIFDSFFRAQVVQHYFCLSVKQASRYGQVIAHMCVFVWHCVPFGVRRAP